MKLSLKALIITVAASLTLAGCATHTVAKINVQDLQAPTWQLSSVDGKVLTLAKGQKAPTFSIDNKMMVSGFAGCNNFFGETQVNLNKLRFLHMNATMMLCEKPAIALEKTVSASLKEWNTVTQTKTTLTMKNKAHTLVFLAKK